MGADFLWIQWIDAVVFGLATACTVFFWRRVQGGETVSASAHWGGLGGGTGGWRVTTALVALLAALFLWTLAAALAIYVAGMQHSDAATKVYYQREDAKIALEEQHSAEARDERHRAEDRAEREAQRIRTEKAAPATQDASTSFGAAKGAAAAPSP